MYASIYKRNLFAGRRAVVTGGGAGIGRCVAHELSSLGCKVIIIGRRFAPLDRTKKEIDEDGGSCEFHSFDVRDEKRVVEFFEEEGERGRIDFLVNNAGGQFGADALSVSKKGYDAILSTNMVGTFLMSREFVRVGNGDAGSRSIVNIVLFKNEGMPIFAHAASAKAGVENLTAGLANEWSQYGVRVNAVALGPIASSGFDTYDKRIASALPQLKRKIPLGRFGTESEASSLIAYLLSDAAAFATGSTFNMDGGCCTASPLFLPQDVLSGRTEAFQGFHRSVPPDILSDG